MEFSDLSPEVQEKAKSCETVEEFRALVEEAGLELTDEELESMAGGIGCFRVTCITDFKCRDKEASCMHRF